MRHERGYHHRPVSAQLKIDNISFALSYNFSPGKNDDGITLTVPLALINQVAAARCEWLVPAYWREGGATGQDAAAETAPQSGAGTGICCGFLPRRTASNMPLLLVLARYIREQNNSTCAGCFPPRTVASASADEFPRGGRAWEAARHVAQLHQLHGELARASRTKLWLWQRPRKKRIRFRPALHLVSFGAFAETGTVKRAGQNVTLYNALVDEAMLSYCARSIPDAAQAAHRGGLRRLFMLLLKEQVKYMEKNCPTRKAGHAVHVIRHTAGIAAANTGDDLRALLPERSAAGERSRIHRAARRRRTPAADRAGTRAVSVRRADEYQACRKSCRRSSQTHRPTRHTRATRMAAAREVYS